MGEYLTEFLKVGLAIIEILLVIYLMKKNEPYILAWLERVEERLEKFNRG